MPLGGGPVRCDRFWNTDLGTRQRDTGAAFATLHTCLATLAGLLAPFTPFLAEELHENLVRRVSGDAVDSVHLAGYPVPDYAARDDVLRAAMLDTHGDAIARDVLAITMTRYGEEPYPGTAEPVQVGNGRALVDVRVVSMPHRSATAT